MIFFFYYKYLNDINLKKIILDLIKILNKLNFELLITYVKFYFN